MKRLLSILLAVGISGLALAKQEKQPQAGAQEAKTTQEALQPKRSFLSIFFAWPLALDAESDDCVAPELCPPGSRCNPCVGDDGTVWDPPPSRTPVPPVTPSY